MSRDRESPDQLGSPNGSSPGRQTKDEEVKNAPRRPYSAPSLRRLGSVRDLTLGSRGGTPDTRFTNKRP